MRRSVINRGMPGYKHDGASSPCVLTARDDGTKGVVMPLSNRIRTLRQSAGLTQGQLAEWVGVTPSTVTLWELGTTRPRMSRLGAIAKALGVSEGELLAETSGRGCDRCLVPVTPSSLGKAPLIGATAEVPASILRDHPESQAIVVEDGSINRVIPPGMVAVYDPEASPGSGQLAVVEVDGIGTVIRRWYRGKDTLLLVADSHGEYEDMVFPRGAEPKVLGTVIWAQPESPFA